MAEFNPQIPESGGTNFTGRSQGTGPNRAFENLFEGLGNTIKNVVEIKDQQNQLDIENDARAAFDQVNNEFGVAATQVPGNMQSDLDRIQTLQNAVSQGKISQTNYYGRLATLSKQLRTKYPGYEGIVDSTVQSVTGTRPANAYRDALFAEVQAVQEGQADSVKFRRQYEKENEGVLNAIYGDDYFTNPDQYDFQEVRSKVSGFKGKAEVIEAENAELTLMAKRGEFNDKRAAKALDRDFAFTTEAVMNRSLGLNSPSASKQIDEFIQKGGGTPQELEGFINTITTLESQLRAELTQKGRTKYVAEGLVAQEEVNKAVEAAMFPLTEAKKAVLGGDFKLASKYSTLSKAMTDNQMYEQLQDPLFRTGAGLTEVNQTLGEEFFARNQEAAETIATEIAGRTMLGQTDVIRKTVESGNSKVARATVDNSFRAIVDPKLSGDKFSNVVDQFFGPQAIDFMSPKVVDPSDLESVYTQFLRPEVTKAIYEKGTQADQDKYREWAFSKALSIPAFRAAAGDINSLRQLDPNVRVEFDPNNLRVKIVSDNPGSRLASAIGMQPYGRALSSVNKVFAVLKPIWEAEGEQAPAMAKELVKSLAINLENRNPENERRGGNLADKTASSFFQLLYDGLSVSEAGASEGPGGQSVLPEVEGEETDLDFMSTQSVGPDGGVTEDDGEFVDPRDNPNVDPEVLSRFQGKRLPASLRLNNMGAVSITGNVAKSWAAKQPGFVGVVSRPKNEGGYYAQYATPEHGVAAASKLLERYGRQGTNTPVEITKKWAATPGNYPNVLVKYLKAAGFDVGRNTPLDLSDPEVRLAILKAKSAHESGAGRPTYSEDVFVRGVNL